MIEFITGAVLGAGGMVAKDLLLGGKQSDTDRQQRQTEQLLSENEKLRNRNREAERRIEDSKMTILCARFRSTSLPATATSKNYHS